MNPNNPQSIGEAGIPAPIQAQTTADVTSPQGKQQLFQHLASATIQKEMLDFIFKGIAEKTNSEFSSRVKNPQTVVQKIAQKRLQGREYNIQDINDAYGSRIIVKSEKQIAEVRKYVEKAADLGLMKIGKSEMIKSDYHKAWHIDFETKQGTKGELQILTPQEEANSVVNHDLRSVHGEKMEGAVKQLADLQSKKAKSLSNNKAHILAQAISDAHKPNPAQPLPPQVNAQMLASMQQNQ